ncbi:hypothetical protein [Rodentibacter caecimuris]
MERVVDLFKIGQSQTIKLPVDFEFNATQIYIHFKIRAIIHHSEKSQ